MRRRARAEHLNTGPTLPRGPQMRPGRRYPVATRPTTAPAQGHVRRSPLRSPTRPNRCETRRYSRCAPRRQHRRIRSDVPRTRNRRHRAGPSSPRPTNRRGRSCARRHRGSRMSMPNRGDRRSSLIASTQRGRDASSNDHERTARSRSARLAAAIGANVTSSASRSAKPAKNAVIWSSEQRASSANASTAASIAWVAMAYSPAGMCNKAPEAGSTINRSPARNS